MTDKTKLPRFDLKKADDKIMRSKSVFGTIGNILLWEAKVATNVGLWTLEKASEIAEQAKEK
jgi:hypothetical protein